MSNSIIVNYLLIIQDDKENIRKVIKIKEISFDKFTLSETNEWLWIFEDTQEFCPFELWEFMNQLKVNDGLIFNHIIYKVIEVFKMSTLRYS
ncbi:hypothetical protein IAE19_06195 [Acinetobacter sp. S40]|uniref:hypothetical protein n=1 Tax=unclassified Acinetobacter TaxID=196816 RepID=UPI00190B92A2|nr:MULTISPECIES: hypothetical protein [unclassified Acinetobacter]MBJ9985034.1 hypothetical protein [Acinetobacter sp. S40]MBK0062975.1 hypothetical protein [Acinetobacter sp. S55]MBK0066607.1 hypothetical protein [Acinetobacter sp. S54]